MRYRVRGLEIRTENAAKPMGQPAKPLTRWLRRLNLVGASLDYGCGKLRYSEALARKSQTITLVDSKIQLDRLQKVGKRQTTVRLFAEKKWPTCRVLEIGEFMRDKQRYDFVLCANVLSAIPDRKIRESVLVGIASSLRSSGQCLFVTQFRNSYFRHAMTLPGATPYMDGWILRTRRGAFYYGMIDKEKLTRLVRKVKLEICEAWTDGESAYVLAGKKHAAFDNGRTRSEQ